MNASFHNALDRMESTADVPYLKTDILGVTLKSNPINYRSKKKKEGKSC